MPHSVTRLHAACTGAIVNRRSRAHRGTLFVWYSATAEIDRRLIVRVALRTPGEALWTFSKVEGVEPTNNAAERAVRKGVLWRKGSFGSHSAEGSRFAERMLAVSESLRAQGRSILDFVEDSIRAGLTGDVRPSLLPAAC